jgi:hypothetical protein
MPINASNSNDNTIEMMIDPAQPSFFEKKMNMSVKLLLLVCDSLKDADCLTEFLSRSVAVQRADCDTL